MALSKITASLSVFLFIAAAVAAHSGHSGHTGHSGHSGHTGHSGHSGHTGHPLHSAHSAHPLPSANPLHSAHPLPSAELSFDEKAYLVTTNAERAVVGVPPLVWNNTVADYARMWAKKRAVGCVFEHSDDGGYAENIATGCCDFSAEDAVKMWLGEKKYYDPATKKCIGGEECGHYANIVAADTTDMGCARVKCDNDWIYMICDYWGQL